MAKLERELKGDFDKLLDHIKEGILNGSMTSTLVDSSDFTSNNSRCSVLVFERYAYTGSNRVSLNVTLYQDKNKDIKVSAITSGGSQGVLFKINKIPENTFLNKFEEVLDSFKE